MSWGLSDRQIARIEALEERMRKKDQAPIFFEVEIGSTFFLNDRIYLKTGPILAREFGSDKMERIDFYAEVGW